MQILTEYQPVFQNTYQILKEYNDNLRNELFEIEPNEDQNDAYKRGERIFDQYEDDLKNITELINQEKEINEFFMKCKQNKQKIIDKMTLTIDKLVRIKKNNSDKEEYINCREEWNNRRIETPDEKNRRECEEMLEEIKEEKRIVNEMKQKNERRRNRRRKKNK